MKRFLKVILCWVILSNHLIMNVYAKTPWPSDVEIKAESGIVVDLDSETILWGKDVDSPYPPASITKLLTALIVLEHSALDETVIFSEHAVNNVESDSGNKLNVTAGDQLSVEDCLYSLLVHSCNQVANALAEHVAGSQEAFVELMNEKLSELGCVNSHFDNPSGLNGDTQYVTARDMFRISKAALSNPKIVEISSARSHKFPPTINNPEGITIYAEHKLLKTTDSSDQYYYPPAKGGKIGYLLKAGNTLVTYAELDGKRLISVILRGSKGQYYLDGKALLEFGFINFENYQISVNEREYISGDAAIEIGGKSYMPSDLEIDHMGVITLPKGSSFSETEHKLILDLQGEYPERSIAYIEYTYENNKVGGAYLKKKETPIVETEKELVSTENNEAMKMPGKQVFRMSFFLICLLSVIIIGSGCIVYIINTRKKEERALALRRKQRRERLRAEGVTDEDFKRLLNQRFTAQRKKK